MPTPITQPFGSWLSPITTDLVVAGGIALGQLAIHGPDIYWIEQRPAEAGRNVIVHQTPDGQTHDINPAPFNARTRVHEYGGGAYLLADHHVCFSNYSDQRLYKQNTRDAASQPQPLTPPSDMRYADAVLDRPRQRLIAIREDHTTSAREAVNTIVALPLEGDLKTGGEILAGCNDFYASPRLSPDGNSLAYLTWNHPNMPWDGCELWLADLDHAGRITAQRKIAGGLSESIFQPEWSPAGILHFVSDKTGWWNLYRWQNHAAEPLAPMNAEFGEPLWSFSQRTYAFTAADEIMCVYIDHGSRLARLDTRTLKLQIIETPYSDIHGLVAAPGFACFIAGSPTQESAIIRLDSPTSKITVLRRSSAIHIDPACISIPEQIEFPTENNRTAFAFYYPPKNPNFTAPPSEKPPLLVRSHGGPTSATRTTLRPAIQYWTSRGFAVVNVNYGGSTGHGRAYRERLNGQWGVVNVDDCCNAAKFLVAKNLADSGRLAIDGGSAGGYTTLCALTFRDTFKAGASLFGIGELEVFTKDTHKYESRYLDHLVGPYPEKKSLYFARSPLNFLDQLRVPLILFQGLEDKIVPPNQAQMMFDAVKQKGLPVAYIAYEGEQHGFRKAANIKRTLEAEFYFFAQIFHFTPADPIPPVKIENL